MGRLGGGSGVCEYIYILSPWLPFGIFGFPWRDFGFHLAPFGIHLAPCGVHLVPFGLHLAPFGGPLGCLWGALGALGALGGLLGLPRAYSRFLLKKGLQFRANGSQVRSLSSKNDLPEFIRGSRQSRRSATWPAARNPPSSRRGLGWR